VGFIVGEELGAITCWTDGATLGNRDGFEEGPFVDGNAVGRRVGFLVGGRVGKLVGIIVGEELGAFTG